jgi:hypothetical protein
MYPRNNVADVLDIIKGVADTFLISTTNPYNMDTDPEKYKLWEEEGFNFNINEELEKYDELFGWLYTSDLSKNLLEFSTQIETFYNNFSNELDVYNFMMNYTIQVSRYVMNLPLYLDNYIVSTWINILSFYRDKLEQSEKLLWSILGLGDSVGLKTIIKRSLSAGTPAKFAWIKRLGHYLIEEIWIKVDDQLVDKHYGEWMEIWHQLTKRVKKERGYNKLIGHVSELIAYNNRKKPEYELLIPLHFWFCRNIGISLPIIALHNADIRVYVKLREFDDVCYYEANTVFRKKPRLSCGLLAEYIYVEQEERTKISTSKLEYLIDVLQFNGEKQINRDSINPETGEFETITKFKNPCKEIFWMLQDIKYTDGTFINSEKRWDFYGYQECYYPLDDNVTESIDIINPASIAKITFNMRDRELFKDIRFYNQTQAYERHYSSPLVGINIYCFALEPESIQPTGAANMTRIDDAGVCIKLKSIVLDNLIDGRGLVFRWPVYALTQNIFRVFSGLGGLVFQT